MTFFYLYLKPNNLLIENLITSEFQNQQKNMRVIRLLFTLVTILFLFSNIAFSQSSIYKDAKELAKHLEDDWSIYVHLQKAKNSQSIMKIKDGKNELTVIQPNHFVIPNYGFYQIEITNSSKFDSIIITNKDSIILKEPSIYNLSIYNYPDKIYIEYIQNRSDANIYDKITYDTTYANVNKTEVDEITGDTVIGTITEMKIDSLILASPPIPSGLFRKPKKELLAGYDILFNLGAHSDFKDVDNLHRINFKNIQLQYSTNPFLSNLNIRSPLLTPNVDIYLPEAFLDSINFNFPEQFYQEYPWHKLLYGDSILSFQETISFKDASISYRKQITTSQNELTEASIRINETNKRKNLLDAKTVAVGLSDFIAERAQEELNLTFFNRFKENLENPSELTVLFPNTKTLLYQFEISNYKTLLSHARESFKVDLDNLGLNFPEVLKLKKYEDLYNSPEVFNLSLIYSIADLAYKEEPVENILVSAFQKLQERKRELNKSINVELADNFIAAVNPKGQKITAISSKQVQNNTELQTLQKYVSEYLDALDNAKHNLEGNLDDVNAAGGNTTNKLEAISTSDKDMGEFTELYYLYENRSNRFRSKFERPFFYNNRQIYEYNFFNFFRKTINANLSGKEYYGYLLEYPHPEDYQLFFKPPPDSINSVLAKGIEGSRNLLTEKFDESINQTFNFLENTSTRFRGITKQYILKVENLNSPAKRILQFNQQVDLLKSAIGQEVVFWRKTTQQDVTDHDIAGLYFLESLLRLDQHIYLFTNVTAGTKDFEKEFESIKEKYYNKSLGEDYQKNMSLAMNQLDSIQLDFENKIHTLTKKYSKLSISDSTYHHQIINTQLQIDTFNHNERLRLLSSNLDFEKILLEDAAIYGQAYPSISISELEPTLIQIIKELHTDKTKVFELGRQLTQLNTELQGVTDPTVKTNLNNQIDQLNDERDKLEEKIEEKLDIELAKIDTKIKEQQASHAPEKQAILAKYQEKINNIQGSSSSKLLSEVYSLQDNSYFEKYKRNKLGVNEINYDNHKEMAIVKDFEAKLAVTKNSVEDLKTKRRQLENYFTHLDTSYCKNLVSAQTNARNLSKSIEFSAHLLFAFRDYERIYDSVFIYDSTLMKVTVNQLDSTTNYINTFSIDSLIIKRKVVEGTTEPLIAARWITKKEFEALRKNKTQWNIFLGLLYQRLRTIDDAPNFSAEGIALLATKFLGITNDMEIYRSNLRRKKATTPNLITFKDYYPFIRSTVDLFNTVLTTPSLGDTSATVSNKFGLQNIPQISNEALSLYENIYVKEYGNAVLNAMELLKIISAKKLNKKEGRKSQRSINAVLTYGTFMANMINAQSSDQVKNILKSATLPPGSSRIKRETVSSFTINSYLGAAVGRDRLLGVPNNLDLKQDAFGASLAVPIGFTYSFSPNIIKNNSSFSIHVPLIDLGAITAYRQNPDNPNYTIDNLPDFSWQNLFSPGAFVVYNFANSPFSLGVGGQYGPQLRQITPTGGEAINVNSWRFPMAFFTIDVPFFNLHTGARKIIVD